MDRNPHSTEPGQAAKEPSILTRIAAGEAGAVGELHDRYGALVWSTVRRGFGKQADEDLVQDIFIDLWRSAAAFDPARGSEAAFVRTIARRRVIDRGRRSRATPAELSEDVAGEDEGPDPLEIEEEARRAMTALSSLPAEKRRVLELVLVSGMSHRAVAEATELPLGTVKSHARRGLKHLRSLLGVPEEENGS